MANKRTKVKKEARKAVSAEGGKKGINTAGRKGRIANGPPGSPQGKHSEPMAKNNICRCGRCQNARLASIV